MVRLKQGPMLGVIEGGLNMAEPMDVDEGYAALCETGSESGPAALSVYTGNDFPFMFQD